MPGRALIADHDNPADMPGDTIAGRYRLLEPLGRGAMSAVWLAHDDELDRRVAVKTLAPTADRMRFEREARAVAALSHPNICALYDYGRADDDTPYMVLECLSGGSLEERLAGGSALPDEETERVASEIAAGLAHAHERGLVHRDLKPANVLFDAEGRAKIADFGIARIGGSGTLTDAGTVLGTAAYISPEQAAGQPAGPASDVYSFGVIVFRMLTGAFPFVSRNAMELVRMHRDEPAPPVAARRPGAPARLQRIADTALQKDPAARPADGAALVRALCGAALASEGASTEVLRPRRPRDARRATPLLLLAGATLALLAGGVALGLVLTHDGGTPAPPPPSLSLPSVPAAGTTTAQPTTAPATTSEQTTTARTSTAATSTAARTTTATTATTLPTTLPATTLPTTTAATLPATTAPTTTTVPATTAPGTSTVDTAVTTPLTTSAP
jgi:eukaryotic-like serine/threonine-protein kinase